MTGSFHKDSGLAARLPAELELQIIMSKLRRYVATIILFAGLKVYQTLFVSLCGHYVTIVYIH